MTSAPLSYLLWTAGAGGSSLGLRAELLLPISDPRPRRLPSTIPLESRELSSVSACTTDLSDRHEARATAISRLLTVPPGARDRVRVIAARLERADFAYRTGLLFHPTCLFSLVGWGEPKAHELRRAWWLRPFKFVHIDMKTRANVSIIFISIKVRERFRFSIDNERDKGFPHSRQPICLAVRYDERNKRTLFEFSRNSHENNAERGKRVLRNWRYNRYGDDFIGKN